MAQAGKPPQTAVDSAKSASALSELLKACGNQNRTADRRDTLIMETFLYFAYGSNMLTSRIRRRCPSAMFRTIATASDHLITFGKPSKDQSGKATLRAMPSSATIACGVVFEISSQELADLDEAEEGYARHEDFLVECLRSGEILRTHTYFSKEHESRLRPYDWYLALILAGIREHGLGDEYEYVFNSIHWERDPRPERQSRLEAIEVLEEAGFAEFRHLLTPLQ